VLVHVNVHVNVPVPVPVPGLIRLPAAESS